jgi:hypothetical protein
MNSRPLSRLSPILVLAMAVIMCQAVVPFGALAADPKVTVESEFPVIEIVDDTGEPSAVLSPDGSVLAWATNNRKVFRPRVFDRDLCIYRFADEATNCIVFPDQFVNVPSHLVWSPDGAYIALTEDPVQLANESDIWTFEVANGTFTNRTDDGVEGSYVSLVDTDFALDYLPMWESDAESLLFWRTVPGGQPETALALYRLDLAGGEEELVTSLSLGQAYPLFNYLAFYLDGPSAISPDGTKVAVAVRPLRDALTEPNSGLWLVDLTDGKDEPRQIASLTDFQEALPDWWAELANPLGLSWTSDGKGVVVAAYAWDPYNPLTLIYYVDAESGAVTPAVDLSEALEPEVNMSQVEDLHSDMYPMAGTGPYYHAPVSTSVSPAGDKLLIVGSGIPSVLVWQLPPEGELPVPTDETELFVSAVPRSSAGSDGKALMGGVLYILTEE